LARRRLEWLRGHWPTGFMGKRRYCNATATATRSQDSTGRLVFSGFSPDGKRVEIVENPSNAFFLATQYHPEYLSRPNRPEPAYLGFVTAAYNRKQLLRMQQVTV
jgi:CTP synthase (UTP-ammonia lyase)